MRDAHQSVVLGNCIFDEQPASPLMALMAALCGSQVAFNRASYAVPQIDAVLSNLLGLLLFLVIAAVLLWFHMRDHVRLFAEAIAVTKSINIEQIR